MPAKKTVHEELLQSIAELLIDDKGKRRTPKAVRRALAKVATKWLVNKGGVSGRLPPKLGPPVELGKQDAARSFKRWITDLHKPHAASVHVLVHVLSELGKVRRFKDEDSRKGFEANLSRLASEFQTKISEVRQTFSDLPGDDKQHSSFATLELRTGLTQLQDDLPFAQDKGFYYCYRRLTGNASNIYRELLVISEDRPACRCYSGAFFSWSKTEWKCTIVPGEITLTVLMNAYNDKEPHGRTMHELMRVIRRHDPAQRFPYLSGLRVGLDDKNECPAAVRVILEKFVPPRRVKDEDDLDYARRVKKKVVRVMRPDDRGYDGFERALFRTGRGRGDEHNGVLMTKDVLDDVQERAPVRRTQRLVRKPKRAA